MTQHMNSHMQQCVENCQYTQQMCFQAVTYCLEQGEEYADPDCVALLITCGEICGTSAKAMLVGSEHHTKICGVCAEICDAVIEDFQEFDDRTSRRLVDAARECAVSCREMSRMYKGTRVGSSRRYGGASYDQFAY